jgi:hypothetical protein
MKVSYSNCTGIKITWWATCVALLFLFAGCRKGGIQIPKFTVTTVATGLASPMGIETQNNGNIWVSESGTAHNDGKVVVIKPNGQKYDAIINLPSFLNKNTGELQGTVHILLDGGTLYVLSGDDLFTVDISHFKPGNTPIDATTLHPENIADFMYANGSADSHPYNLTKGPNGDLYISDAGANAIIHRKGVGNYSILAAVPGIANPTPVGPPQIQSVPTSILWDGQNFLVTTLIGFPFPAGESIIYRISLSGNVSVYQKGFTSLVDQAAGIQAEHIVVQYASSFNLGTGAFAPNSGSLLWVNGINSDVLEGGLNMPVSIKQVNNHTWYVVVMGDGTVVKISN